MSFLRFCFLSFVVTLFISGCGKDKPADPPPPPPPPIPTLPAGWHGANTNQQLLDVFFVDEKTGYLCGEKYIGKSTDGGVTWAAVQAPVDSINFTNIFFRDANTGWILGDNTMNTTRHYILKTTDGGASWKKISLPTDFYDIQFLSRSQGYGAASRQLYLTSDSGNTWKATAGQFESGPVALFFRDSAIGWLTNTSKILVTKDGGKSFTAQHSPFNGNPVGIQFTDANHGWVPGDKGIYKTVNGGSNWEFLPLQALQGQALDVHFFNDNEGYVLQENTILKTTNGGTSFTPLFYTNGYLIELHFTDAKHGWAVTRGGGLYRYVQP